MKWAYFLQWRAIWRGKFGVENLPAKRGGFRQKHGGFGPSGPGHTGAVWKFDSKSKVGFRSQVDSRAKSVAEVGFVVVLPVEVVTTTLVEAVEAA